MAAIAIAKTVFDFVGSVYQGEQAARSENAAGDLALQNARNARLQGNAQEEAQRRQIALNLGNMRASAAESGFDASTGSLADLQTRNAGEMELDALTTRYQSQLQALSFENEAATRRVNAKNARKSGYMNAFGSLLSNGANYFGQPRVGAPAPVETRTPRPNPYYTG